MRSSLKNNFNLTVTVIAVTVFFSCQGNYKEVQKLSVTERFPGGVAENFQLTYTDSGVVKAILTSPLNTDFSNQEFPYQEFPKGLSVEFFDEQQKKSVVTADYGIIYSATNLIDLQGNVILETHDGKKLEAPQIYWDQSNEWIFTKEKFVFTNPEEGTIMHGEGIDFDKEFKVANAHKTYGVFSIED
ncbi:LPS export ABC transporter periplasmic protein LptC [Leptobacterium sp. I13]|uniref:LPS export ABC transporter periplasmic protein LptC n=1 Tax=Leptobacterium meishanense TaxID=3128904 RepID=UPI0030EDD62A